MLETPHDPFDPLDYENIAKSVVDALLDRPIEALGQMMAFNGAGIYAIYYAGPFAPYNRIVSRAGEIPIYVGKAVPPGARKGTDELHVERSQVLCRRLAEHAKSISEAQNLTLTDFTCRHLVVQPVWIPLAEQVLVQRFRPVWNTVVDGFGNHPPGRGRGAMRRPRWDIIHPGRRWASELRAEESEDDILDDVRRHLDAWAGAG